MNVELRWNGSTTAEINQFTLAPTKPATYSSQARALSATTERRWRRGQASNAQRSAPAGGDAPILAIGGSLTRADTEVSSTPASRSSSSGCDRRRFSPSSARRGVTRERRSTNSRRIVGGR